MSHATPRAYAASEHIRAALEIYRAFPANEKFNAAVAQLIDRYASL